MRPIAHALCLLVALTQAVLGARSLVLCIEPWGTIKIEAAAAAGCVECPEGPRNTDDSTSDGQACPCIDVAISNAHWPACTRVHEVLSTLQVQWTTPASELGSALARARHLSAADRTLAGSAASDVHRLGTVVLRV